ncbi:uncharacterized protein LOC128189725 [Crassostrea angulata]|uniref:uncharacterized protein LOC128189725 n=1 Tax=Magallana angulata TaxID=2784310 RepID=UPI0022B21597|nr:uncharacterized protein LOC128189725 [Crassostrea angulata]
MSRTWLLFEIIYIYFAVVFTTPCNRVNTICCYNEYFNEKSKECTVCKNGSFGWNCEISCKSGFYGYLCSTPCECEAHLCDIQTGCQSSHNETSPLQTLNKISTAFSKTVFTESTYQMGIHQTSESAVRKKPIQSNEKQPWILVSFLLIGSLTTFVVCGTSFYFRKGCIRRLMDLKPGRPVGVHQCSRTNNSPTIDRSLGYDDIRHSQMIRNSNISEESCFTSSRTRMTSDSVKSRHLLSIIYDNYHEDDEDYSRLLLRKRQSVCIAKKNIAYDDDGYAFLRLGITELKPDLIIRRHRSLPLISSIQNSISLGSQDVKRCLSESNIPL